MTLRVTPRQGDVMAIKILALIAQTEKQIVAENDPKKRKTLYADLQAMKKTYKKVSEEETEESGEEDEEEEAEEEGGNETDREEGDPPPKAKKDDDDDDDEEDDDDDEEDDEEEEEEAKALTAAVAKVGGKRGARLAGHLQALIDKARANDEAAARIAKIEKERRIEKRDAKISAALTAKGGPRISPADAKWLRTQSLTTVDSYLSQRTKAIVNTEDVIVLEDGRPGANISEAVKKQIDKAVAAGGDRAALEEAHKKAGLARAEKGIG